MGRKLDPEKARQKMLRATQGNFVPLVPYPGAGKPWKGMCKQCNGYCSPQYNNVVNSGQTHCVSCAHTGVRKFSHHDAVSDMVKATSDKWKPVQLYPGADVPWRGECRDCGQIVSPRYNNVVNTGFSHCVFCRHRKIALKTAEHRRQERMDLYVKCYRQPGNSDLVKVGAGRKDPYRTVILEKIPAGAALTIEQALLNALHRSSFQLASIDDCESMKYGKSYWTPKETFYDPTGTLVWQIERAVECIQDHYSYLFEDDVWNHYDAMIETLDWRKFPNENDFCDPDYFYEALKFRWPAAVIADEAVRNSSWLQQLRVEPNSNLCR